MLLDLFVLVSFVLLLLQTILSLLSSRGGKWMSLGWFGVYIIGSGI